MENFECFYGGFALRFLGLDRVSSYDEAMQTINNLKEKAFEEAKVEVAAMKEISHKLEEKIYQVEQVEKTQVPQTEK